MTPKTRESSLGRTPAATLEKEALLAILRTADLLERRLEAVLASSGLSSTQYNVLRILRGAGPDGLTCGETGARMITRDPDITRLLDRLNTRGLISRVRDTGDRRVILVRITEEGLRLLEALDAPVEALDRRHLGGLGETELRRLARLLERIRESGV